MNQDLIGGKPLFNFGKPMNYNVPVNQSTGLGPTKAMANMLDNTQGGFFKDMQASDAISGISAIANIGFGLENLEQSKDLLGITKQKYADYKEDRELDKEQRARLRAIRF